ncbi:glycoside hydrolase family 88 protein [Paenibacillus sp. HB172176]|uniref:glycoside hydrolase family 88/105 protein n=1 Tax=Paenibacillus sp. HB172176 TaxID=2493690 RepID=UPI001F0D0AE5|nr:glycoside hydrolase family 88 protein [Paenibacillus sp. HB172176]
MTIPSGPYFEREESMAAAAGIDNIPRVLETIAQRYVGQHPPHEPVFRVTRESGIRKLPNHLYDIPADRLFPDMAEGQYVYAWAKLWAEEAHDFVFHLHGSGPMRLYLGGKKRFGSAPKPALSESVAAEGEADAPLKLKLRLERGWNHFVLELGKAAGGDCGAQFGTGSRKNKPLHFLIPSSDREGEEGWLYTAPLDSRLSRIPSCGQPESATGAKWLPKREEGRETGRLEQIYGSLSDRFAFAWTTVANRASTRQRITLKGIAYGGLSIRRQGKETVLAREGGPFAFEFEAEPGRESLILRCSSGSQGWGFRLETVEPECAGISLEAPVRAAGMRGEWLYLGPFHNDYKADPQLYMSMDAVAENGEERFYWMAGPGEHVRPFLENELFGRWNYPLGVTLFGLLETSGLLKREDLADYVARHVEFASSMYGYSLWDRERFGAAGLNNQLSDIDSLDDCGSFGALAILADGLRPIKGVCDVSHAIARYIMETQDRMEDGALYRRIGVSPSMHNTMWCDDMYMSVPFLCRYAEMTGEACYVDEASRQLLLYKKYLYMPRLRIMSHVYDVSRGEPSRTAWGRGNGWVFFSLAALLKSLQTTHKHYNAILAFYRELAEGYLRLQGEHGLWHQVLTDSESYEEASCTSMFMYGFALGVQHGWLEQPERFAESAQAGWRGLCERAIDRKGNLYGVCKGSSWSYSHMYYKHELGWSLNDTHGIGIALLAGIETCRMQKQFESHSGSAAASIQA